MEANTLFLINEKVDRVIECLYLLSESLQGVDTVDSTIDQIIGIGDNLRHELDKRKKEIEDIQNSLN